MRLLDLVEQHHGVGATANRLGELTTLLVAHVTRRSTDESADCELLHVFTHVESHHGPLVVEEEPSQRARQFRLAHTRRTEEQERANRSVRIGEPGTRTTNCVGYCHHCLVLAHDSRVK